MQKDFLNERKCNYMKDKNMIRKLILPIILILLTTIIATAQIPGDKSRYYNYGTRFFAEIHLLPAQSPDSVKALLMLKVSYSTLNFIKPQDIQAVRDQFAAFPYVEAEIKDSQGIIRKLIEWRDTVITDDYSATTVRDVFLSGLTETVLVNDAYSAVIKLYDQNMRLVKEIKIPEIKKTEFYNSPSMTVPVLASKEYNEINDQLDIYPYIFSDQMPFSDNDPALFITVSYDDEFPSYDYQIKLETEDITGLEWKNPTDLKGRITPLENQCLTYERTTEKGLLFQTKQMENNINEQKFGLLVIDFPKENMVPGKYKLTLSKTNTKDTLVHYFYVKWMSMPLSLYNYQYAAEMMYYILTEDELNTIQTGSIEEVRLKIWYYWMNNDPSPNTLYNEAMKAYFDRVDYAYYNFKTFNQKDGAKTARGKIYILKGEPEEIIRNINDGVIIEKWRYPNLKQEFVFTTENNANYDLKEINGI
jgi:GWxTD domain-containing protein